MNTPAHLIFGLAAFGRPGQAGVTAAALIGAALPDLSLYALVAWEQARGTSAQVIFDQLYFSDAWMAVFAVDNSLVLWGAVLALALWLGRGWAVALAGAALLHIALDLPLHGADARPHFWPISDWRFHSPVSYWDPAHHGTLVGAVEIAACLALTVLIWRRFRALWVRALAGGLLALECAPVLLWALVFA